jgi:hypothetical protein
MKKNKKNKKNKPHKWSNNAQHKNTFNKLQNPSSYVPYDVYMMVRTYEKTS